MAEFDLFTSRRLRDEAIEIVSENNEGWMDSLRSFIGNIPIGWIGVGEDIRVAATPVIGKPKKPQAWGAGINWAVRWKLLEPTGRYGQMKCVTSHGRETKEYKRV